MSDSASQPRRKIEFCRAQQTRLLEEMRSQSVERTVLLAPENVQWLTGF